jgi:hypothetical protein
VGGTHTAHLREMRNSRRILAKKPEGKRMHGTSKYRGEDNIKMNLK